MKMVFNILQLVTFEKLMMKIYDFFIRLSRLVALYNNMKNHWEDGRFFTYYYLLLDNDLAE